MLSWTLQRRRSSLLEPQGMEGSEKAADFEDKTGCPGGEDSPLLALDSCLEWGWVVGG